MHFGLVAQSVSLPLNYARGRLLRKCQKKVNLLAVFIDCERSNRCRGRWSWEEGKFPPPARSMATPEKKRNARCFWLELTSIPYLAPYLLLLLRLLHPSRAVPHPPHSGKGSSASRPTRLHAFPITLDESSIFAFGRCRPKISPRALEESHAFTPPPPTRQISDFSR